MYIYFDNYHKKYFINFSFQLRSHFSIRSCVQHACYFMALHSYFASIQRLSESIKGRVVPPPTRSPFNPSTEHCPSLFIHAFHLSDNLLISSHIIYQYKFPSLKCVINSLQDLSWDVQHLPYLNHHLKVYQNNCGIQDLSVKWINKKQNLTQQVSIRTEDQLGCLSALKRNILLPAENM